MDFRVMAHHVVCYLKFAQCILEDQPLTLDTSKGAVNNMREEIAKTLLRETESHKNLCHHCGSEETDDMLWIGCDNCSRWYHHSCLGQPPLDADYLCPLCL
nr:uncharacterized protein LOC131128292 isoform X2 [Doryrhamphus excisus]